MAQIRIEKDNNNGSFLPWILGLLVLGLLVWGAFAFLDDEDNDSALLDAEEVEAPLAEMATEITGQPDGTYTDLDDEDDFNLLGDAAVVRFMDYTASMKGEMGLDHEFSHNALTYLADATENLADALDVEITDNTERAKEMADAITKDPYATNHADMIRMAALNITETLERINKWGYDSAFNDEVMKVRKEAQQINAKTLTLNQKEDVRTFFSAARNALSAMGS